MPSWGEQWSYSEISENNAIFTQNIEHNLRSPTLEQLQSDSGTQQQGRNSGKTSYLVTRLRNNTADNIHNFFYFRYYLISVPLMTLEWTFLILSIIILNLDIWREDVKSDHF